METGNPKIIDRTLTIELQNYVNILMNNTKINIESILDLACNNAIPLYLNLLHTESYRTIKDGKNTCQLISEIETEVANYNYALGCLSQNSKGSGSVALHLTHVNTKSFEI